MYKILVILASCCAGLLAFFYSDQRLGVILCDTSLGGYVFFASILYGCCILISLVFSPQGLQTLAKQDSQECMKLIDEIYTTITRCNIFAFLLYVVWVLGFKFIADNKLVNAVIIFTATFLLIICILHLKKIVQYAIFIIKEIALYNKES